MPAPKRKQGWVALVGAGPGDPGLLTLRGCALLRHADVVIGDELVDASLFRFAPQAQKIVFGKHGGVSKAVQQKIIHTLISEARKGKGVVRLKGGDPYIFGRGAEEAVGLRRARIPFEVVSGVSAGHAVPAYAGIPLTDRHHSSLVTFVTGHEAENKNGTRVDWSLMAKQKGTLVTFMGLTQLTHIVTALIKGGRSPAERIAVIAHGTTGRQRVVSGTLASIRQKIKRAKLRVPALAVVGAVNKLRPMLNWFEKRPLLGVCVVVTRAQEQAGALAEKLRRLGADVEEYPTVKIEALPHAKVIAETIRHLSLYDVLIFTSPNGVEHFWRHLRTASGDARSLAHVRIVAIGPGTDAELNKRGIYADAVPLIHTSEHVFRLMEKQGWISGKRILMPRADIAPKDLALRLEKAGAALVTDLPIYRTRIHRLAKEKTATLGKSDDKIRYLTFTSSSTATHFARSLGRRAQKVAGTFRIVSIGPVTSRTVRALGMRVRREARSATIDGLIEAILEDRTGKRNVLHSNPLYDISNATVL